uniref:Uncharacterized protein n=1 Tax=Tanacetum cinerariifolium TaxID=118510 RepID=A0A699GGR2_TANCI|nr:hypothetical protein [Tanacetum cinerariifolium]
MLNKDNYVLWSSRLLRYAKSKLNGKLLMNFVLHGPYVRQMIVEPGDPNHTPPVAEYTHDQTDDKLTEKEAKQMEAGDQAIQTILMGLPEDIYATVDSCIQNVGNKNGLIVVTRIENWNANLIGDGNVVAARAVGKGNGKNGDEVSLSGGDIYDDPSLMRFYQNDDVPSWGNSKQKEGEDGPEWAIRRKFEDELANFMLQKKFYTKGIGEMIDQHREEMHEQFS